MTYHFSLFFATALIPLLLGMIWYNPKVFGTAWMKASGLTPESAKGMNMLLVFGLTYVFGLFLSAALAPMVIHQMGMNSLAMPEPGTEQTMRGAKWLEDGISLFGHSYRRYRHGAFHGALFAVTALLPVIGVNALFERRGFKYIAINWGFWAVCSVIMGAIICRWL